jgi:hypothetical protein
VNGHLERHGYPPAPFRVQATLHLGTYASQRSHPAECPDALNIDLKLQTYFIKVNMSILKDTGLSNARIGRKRPTRASLTRIHLTIRSMSLYWPQKSRPACGQALLKRLAAFPVKAVF